MLRLEEESIEESVIVGKSIGEVERIFESVRFSFLNWNSIDVIEDFLSSEEKNIFKLKDFHTSIMDIN